MRNMILPLLLVALPAFVFASGPAKMLVVVHSSDRVVRSYVCNTNNGAGMDAPVFRTEVMSKGGLSWHVVGGVAPYRVIRDEMQTKTGGCITVMDAEGQTATGCGVVGIQQIRLAVDCQGFQKLDDGPYGLVPNDSTDAARTNWNGNNPPSNVFDVYPPVSAHPSPPTGGNGPDITYHPPVKFPSPVVPTPVKPGPNDVVKERNPVKVRPHTGPSPQPRVINRGSTSPKVTSPTRRSRNTGTSPRPSTPPTSRTPSKTNSTW